MMGCIRRHTRKLWDIFRSCDQINSKNNQNNETVIIRYIMDERMDVFSIYIHLCGQTDIYLRIQEENGSSVINLNVDDGKGRSFKLTKDNLCGLETGRIIAPPTFGTCINGRQDSGPYLLLIFTQKSTSVMILLLHTGGDDQLTLQWKYIFQKNLGFAKSWPNIDLEYTNGNLYDRRKHSQTTKTTIMLGKTWLAFFKYIKDSLPCLWKRFCVDEIIKMRLEPAGTYANEKERDKCFIHVGNEIFTISTGRSKEIYESIDAYRIPPITDRPNSSVMPSPHITRVPPDSDASTSISPRSTVSHLRMSSNVTTSSSSCSDRTILIYPVDVYSFRNKRPNKSRLKIKRPRIQDEYLTMAKLNQSLCQQKVPESVNGELPPPSPCGHATNIQAKMLSDLYIDRPYIEMGDNCQSPKFRQSQQERFYRDQRIVYLTLPIEYNEYPYTHSRYGIMKQARDIQECHIDIDCEEPQFQFDDNLELFGGSTKTVFEPDLETIISESEHQSMVSTSVNTDASYLQLQAYISMHQPDDNDNENHALRYENQLQFQFEFTPTDNDKPLKCISKQFSHDDVSTQVAKSKNLNNELHPPPTFCGSPPRNSSKSYMYKRSASTSDVYNETSKENNIKSVILEKLKKWSRDFDGTLRWTNISNSIIEPLYTSIYNSSEYGYNSDILDEIEKTSEDESYDLQMLTFPINNLDEDKKQEIFYWITKFIKDQHSQSTDVDNTKNIATAVRSKSQTIDCSEEDRHLYNSHGVRMRRSTSSCEVNGRSMRANRTSSMIYGYWSATSIIRTLDKVLRNKPPLPDTLGLSKPLRKELCGRLYTGYSDQAKHDWQALAGEIGLPYQSVQIIEMYLANHPIKCTAAEIVLNHWQFISNKYCKNGKQDYTKCSHQCTVERLLFILHEKLERPDLFELVQEGIQSQRDHGIRNLGDVNNISVVSDFDDLPNEIDHHNMHNISDVDNTNMHKENIRESIPILCNRLRPIPVEHIEVEEQEYRNQGRAIPVEHIEVEEQDTENKLRLHKHEFTNGIRPSSFQAEENIPNKHIQPVQNNRMLTSIGEETTHISSTLKQSGKSKTKPVPPPKPKIKPKPTLPLPCNNKKKIHNVSGQAPLLVLQDASKRDVKNDCVNNNSFLQDSNSNDTTKEKLVYSPYVNPLSHQHKNDLNHQSRKKGHSYVNDINTKLENNSSVNNLNTSGHGSDISPGDQFVNERVRHRGYPAFNTHEESMQMNILPDVISVDHNYTSRSHSSANTSNNHRINRSSKGLALGASHSFRGPLSVSQITKMRSSKSFQFDDEDQRISDV